MDSVSEIRGVYQVLAEKGSNGRREEGESGW